MKHKKKNKKLSEFLKGKSFEDRYGKEKAKLVKDKLSKNASRTWEDKFGKETTKILKQKAKERIKQINDKTAWTKEKAIESVKKFCETNKLNKSILWKPEGRPIPTAKAILRFYDNLDDFAKDCNITFNKHNRSEYLKQNPEVLKKIMKNNDMFKKGFTLDKLYSEKESKAIREKMSNGKKEAYKTKPVWNKGKVGVQKIWNKGLTKKDHEGIRRYAKARVKYMQENKGNFISSHELKVCKFLKENNIEFKQQHYIKDIQYSYNSDIYIKDKKLVIEVDGIYWHNKPGRRELDKKRTKQMKEQGYKVLRFTDKEIDKQLDKVKEIILEKLN